MKSAYKPLILKPEGKRQFGRPKSRRKDNIKRESYRRSVCDGVGWVPWLKIGTSGEFL